MLNGVCGEWGDWRHSCAVHVMGKISQLIHIYDQVCMLALFIDEHLPDQSCLWKTHMACPWKNVSCSCHIPHNHYSINIKCSCWYSSQQNSPHKRFGDNTAEV